MTKNYPKIDVLDHGFLRLVDHMGDDLAIVRAARVSYDADWRANESESADDKLIGYLMRNGHTSPFEAVEFKFEVKAPIFVLRQWMRHRTWSFSEVSARYAELPSEFYLPSVDVIGQQSPSSKQARDISEPCEIADELVELMRATNQASVTAYRQLLEWLVPRELARTVLPVSMYSRIFAKVDLHNLMQFLRLRLHDHAQYEIRVYAEAIESLIQPIVPVAMRHFRELQHGSR